MPVCSCKPVTALVRPVLATLRAAVVTAAAVTAAVVAGTAVAAPTTRTVLRCSASDSGAGAGAGPPLRTLRVGAGGVLVPAGATTLLVCRYTGMVEPPPDPTPAPAFALEAQRLIVDGATVRSLAAQLDAIKPAPSGVMFSCPAGFGRDLIAEFGYPSGATDSVTIDTGGCNELSNGAVSRLGRDAHVIASLEALVPEPRPARVVAELKLCGGPAPGRCRVSALRSCGPAAGSCVSADEVEITTARGGRAAATVRLHRGRAAPVELLPGSYGFALLEDGAHARRRVLQTRHATVAPGRLTTVTFVIPVP